MTALTIKPGGIPQVIRDIAQWCIAKGVGKDKQPYQALKPNKRASCTDPSTWTDFQTAYAAYCDQGDATGLWLALTKDDPYTVIDLDDCVNEGRISPEATEIVEHFDTYTEFSMSGTGLHIVMKATKPGPKCRTGWMEMYDSGRFISFTGHRLQYNSPAVQNQQEELEAFYGERWGLPKTNDSKVQSPAPVPSLRKTDETLLEHIRASAQGEKFNRLWNGDTSDYASGENDGHSEADLALISILLWWTDYDAAAADQLFRRSGLMRPKWDEKRGASTYGEITISKAREEKSSGDGFAGNTVITPSPAKSRQEQQGGTGGGGDGESRGHSKQSKKDTLVELAEDDVLFHTPDRIAYASVKRDGHTEVHAVRRQGYRALLARRYYDTTGGSLGSQAMQDALGVIEARALFDGPEESVHVRLAEQNGRIYYDLGDPTWRVVEISSDGWHVLDHSPVRFIRPSSCRSLPEPQRGGDLREIKKFVNIGETDLPLLIAFLLGCMRPGQEYPLLILVALHGSGKSSLARIVTQLIDPKDAPLRSPPRNERDLLVAAENSHLMAFDNLSHLPMWLSDSFCRLSTGGGLSTRQLYSNKEETIFDARRPVILTGIDDTLVDRPDLLDRSILLQQPRITMEARVPNRFLEETFEAARPRLLGALFDAVATGLRLPNTKIENPPRMADFATWVTSCAPGTPYTPEEFLEAYRENRRIGSSVALDASPLPNALHALPTPWAGTATDLLDLLDRNATEIEKGHNEWPKSPSSLSRKLRRIAPNLEEQGIFLTISRNNRGSHISIEENRDENWRHGVTAVTKAP